MTSKTFKAKLSSCSSKASMDGVTFRDWWLMNDHLKDFWIVSPRGVAVSLGPLPLYIFQQILQHMKWYHDKFVPYGNLVNGVTIQGNQVNLSKEKSDLPDSLEELLDLLEKDLVDFKNMFEWAENQAMRLNVVQQAPASRKFHELYAMLPRFRAFGVDGLSRFAFFLRNNPLLMSASEKHIFSRQVLTIYEFNETRFAANINLGELQGWSLKLTDPLLTSVRDYKRRKDPYPINYLDYQTPAGSIKFLRNCEGHIRDGVKGHFYNDVEIMTIFENDLPDVIPTWFNSLVWNLELDSGKSSVICGKSWMEFLKGGATIFT